MFKMELLNTMRNTLEISGYQPLLENSYQVQHRNVYGRRYRISISNPYNPLEDVIMGVIILIDMRFLDSKEVEMVAFIPELSLYFPVQKINSFGLVRDLDPFINILNENEISLEMI